MPDETRRETGIPLRIKRGAGYENVDIVEMTEEEIDVWAAGVDDPEKASRWIAALTKGWVNTLKEPSFRCRAQRTADPPQDCGWPTCGCDPHADKVIESLQESDIATPATARLRSTIHYATAIAAEYGMVPDLEPLPNWLRAHLRRVHAALGALTSAGKTLESILSEVLVFGAEGVVGLVKDAPGHELAASFERLGKALDEADVVAVTSQERAIDQIREEVAEIADIQDADTLRAALRTLVERVLGAPSRPRKQST